MTLPRWVRDIQIQRAQRYRRWLILTSIGLTVIIFGPFLTIVVLWPLPKNGPPIQMYYPIAAAYLLFLIRSLILGEVKATEQDKLASNIYVISEGLGSDPNEHERKSILRIVNQTKKLVKSSESKLKENEVAFGPALESLKGIRELLERTGAFLEESYDSELSLEVSKQDSEIAEKIHKEKTVDRPDIQLQVANQIAKFDSILKPSVHPGKLESLGVFGLSLGAFVLSTPTRYLFEILASVVLGYLLASDLTNRAIIAILLLTLMAIVESSRRLRRPPDSKTLASIV